MNGIIQKNQMTQWHIDMQNIFSIEGQEKVLTKNNQKRFADIQHGNKIIEFQHSPMSHNEFVERTKFYSEDHVLIWVFDMQGKNLENNKTKKGLYKLPLNDVKRFATIQKANYKKLKTIDDNLLCFSNLAIDEEDDIVSYFYLILQIEKDKFLLVNFYNNEGYCNGKFLNYKQFVNFLKNKPLTFKSQEVIDRASKCVNHNFVENTEISPNFLDDYKCTSVNVERTCKLCYCRRLFKEDILHDYTSWSVIEPSTCTEEGIEQQSCKRCGKSNSRRIKINPNNHDFDIPYTIAQPTCTTKGKAISKCLKCGIEKIIEKEIDPSIHNYMQIKETLPSCTSDGETVYECEYCKKTKIIPISKVPHKFEEYMTNPTCILEGIKGKRCRECGVLILDDIIPKIEHHELNKTNYIQPTCTTNWSYDYYCDICKKHYTKTIITSGHDYETKYYYDSKLCRHYVCKNCGHDINTYYHHFENGICTECGYKKDI